MDTQTLASQINAKSRTIRDLKALLRVLEEVKSEAQLNVIANDTSKANGEHLTISVNMEEHPAIYKVLHDAVNRDLQKNTNDIKEYAKSLYNGI